MVRPKRASESEARLEGFSRIMNSSGRGEWQSGRPKRASERKLFLTHFNFNHKER